MKGLGELVAQEVLKSPVGSGSSGAGPFGRFGVLNPDAPASDLPPVMVERAAPTIVDATVIDVVVDNNDWVLSCITRTFDTPPHVITSPFHDRMLARAPERRAVAPAPAPAPAPVAEPAAEPAPVVSPEPAPVIVRRQARPRIGRAAKVAAMWGVAAVIT